MSRYRKLEGRIIEIYGSKVSFSKAIGMSEQLLSRKLNDKVCWKSKEMEKAIKILNIRRKEIPDFFFPIS